MAKVRFTFWTALAIATYTLSFISKAAQDGEITLDEILQYLQGLARQLNLDVKIKLPDQDGGAQG